MKRVTIVLMVPDWAKYIVQDRDGDWNVCEKEPRTNGDRVAHPSGRVEWMAKTHPTIAWRESVREIDPPKTTLKNEGTKT